MSKLLNLSDHLWNGIVIYLEAVVRIIQSPTCEVPMVGNGAEYAQHISAPSSLLPNSSTPWKAMILSSQGLRLRITALQPSGNRSGAPLPSRASKWIKGWWSCSDLNSLGWEILVSYFIQKHKMVDLCNNFKIPKISSLCNTCGRLEFSSHLMVLI